MVQNCEKFIVRKQDLTSFLKLQKAHLWPKYPQVALAVMIHFCYCCHQECLRVFCSLFGTDMNKWQLSAFRSLGLQPSESIVWHPEKERCLELLLVVMDNDNGENRERTEITRHFIRSMHVVGDTGEQISSGSSMRWKASHKKVITSSNSFGRWHYLRELKVGMCETAFVARFIRYVWCVSQDVMVTSWS